MRLFLALLCVPALCALVNADIDLRFENPPRTTREGGLAIDNEGASGSGGMEPEKELFNFDIASPEEIRTYCSYAFLEEPRCRQYNTRTTQPPAATERRRPTTTASRRTTERQWPGLSIDNEGGSGTDGMEPEKELFNWDIASLEEIRTYCSYASAEEPRCRQYIIMTTQQPTTTERRRPATTERPTTERPTTERPTTERPTTERPTTERPTRAAQTTRMTTPRHPRPTIFVPPKRVCFKDRDCGYKKFCHRTFGRCESCMRERQLCRRRGMCCKGMECRHGVCTMPIKLGRLGSRCKADRDCDGDTCCAKTWGRNICKPRLPEGTLCNPPKGGLLWSLHSHCPCQDGLICAPKLEYYHKVTFFGMTFYLPIQQFVYRCRTYASIGMNVTSSSP